jgi:UPF0755 protein
MFGKKKTPATGEPKKKEKLQFEKKARANTGCLRGVLYFLIIFVVSISLAVFGWNCVNDVLALNKPNIEAAITISENFTIPELARELADKGIINHAWLFTLFCNFSDAWEKIEPGEYTVSSKLDYNAIVKSFVNVPVREVVRVVVPEGKTLLETLQMLHDAGVCDIEDLIRAADEEDFNFDFLSDLPMFPGRLEGYLFPDTYDFYTQWNPRSALLKFLNTFQRQLTPSMRKRLDEPDFNFDLNELLTIASLIQMEAGNIPEMRDISSVIYNRLERNMPLELDATQVYLLRLRDGIQPLTPADINAARSIVSPYNTFQNTGLPPGPICSPGGEAIRAALYPYKTNYLYYALHKDGHHEFFATREAFNRFLASDGFYLN